MTFKKKEAVAISKQICAAPIESVGLKVRLAFLHQAITVPGICGAEKTLSASKIPGIKMVFTPNIGLIFTAKGTTVLVPHANVCNAILEDSEG